MTRTASCYTHKVQVVASASNLKVNYPGQIASTPQPMAATLACNLSFTPPAYVHVAKCLSHKPACLNT